MNRFDPSGSAATVSVHRTIRNVPRTAWDACFPGDPESWGYYRALEQSRLTAFSFLYLVARQLDRIVALAPAFVMDYRLLTLSETRPRFVPDGLWRWFKRRLALRVVCLGSPLADRCHVGFAAELQADQRRQVGLRMLSALDAFAAAHRIGIVAAKDVSEADSRDDLGACLAEAGFQRAAGLPIAVLELTCGSSAAYLASLSHAARRDVRRKLRTSDLVRTEILGGREAVRLVPEIFQLYEGQRGRAKAHFDEFERLTPEYFQGVLTELGEAAIVFLYWHQDRLIAFNLCLRSERMLIDKFIGFRQPLARALNLYVLSWMSNVRYCLERSIPLLQTGQTAYPMKLHLGSRLQPVWIYYRHRNPVLNLGLRLAAPLLAAAHVDRDQVPHRGSAA